MLNKFIKAVSLLVFCVALSAIATESTSVKNTPIENTATDSKPLPIMRGVGGDFTAVGIDGKPFQLSRYRDKVILLFFGYTNCADICPFTLGYLKSLYEKLTPAEQNKVQIVFVTIDPEYDTPEHLREYLAFFNKDFTAATGTRAQIDSIVQQYQATYSKTSGSEKVKTKEMRRVNQKDVADKNTDAAYVYSHSVNIYVMDGKLRVRQLEYTGTKQAQFLHTIRQLISEQSGKITAIEEKRDTTHTIETILETPKKSTPMNLAHSKVKLPILLNYWVHLGPPNTRVMAAYGDFVNTGDKDIYLVGVENSDFDHAELHETVIENKVSKMVAHDELLIPAGEVLKFVANQRHIMLVTPFKRFKHTGETTMTFKYRLADSDEILTQTVVFPVSFNGEGCGAMPLY